MVTQRNTEYASISISLTHTLGGENGDNSLTIQIIMCNKKYHKNESDYQESRYSDGKHFSKKNKNVDKKSRNNVKTNLKKEYL
jgi:hypothetical protein